MQKKNPHAVALGRKGGLAKSAAKTRAARRNAMMGAALRRLRLKLYPESDPSTFLRKPGTAAG